MKKNVYPKQYHNREEERKFEISDVEGIERELKPLVIKIVERAFRRYAKAHGADLTKENLEWTRFKKILNGML